MAANKFHISDDGVARKCEATKKPCKFGDDEEHYSTQEEAQKAAEIKLSKEFSKTTLSKKDRADVDSADNSYTYAKFSVLTDHLHNASAVGAPQELFYYSSKTGRLELNRRIAQDSVGYSDHISRYQKIADVLDSPDFVKPVIKTDEEIFAQKVKEGEKIIRSNSLTFEDISRRDEFGAWKKARENQTITGTFLLSKSYEWMKNLSTQEQEAIAFTTSNGFSAIEGSLHDELTEQTHRTLSPFFEEEIDEIMDNEPDYNEAIRKEKEFLKKKADEITAHVQSAIKKAPVLDEPISVYRGTDGTELRRILGVSADTDFDELTERLNNNEFEGKLLSEMSHMTKVPKSATVIPTRATSFTGSDKEMRDVVLKIQQKSMASPTMVSAWGVAEGEIFTNPNSNYRIQKVQDRSQYKGLDEDTVVLELVEEPKE